MERRDQETQRERGEETARDKGEEEIDGERERGKSERKVKRQRLRDRKTE